MRLHQWTLAQRRMLGIGLALVGSGIAWYALFLPWDYRCYPFDPTMPVCVDPGRQDVSTLTPLGPHAPQVFPQLLVLLPVGLVVGLVFALLLAFVPSTRRRIAGVFLSVVGVCGVCGALGVLWLTDISWSDQPVTHQWDWGVAVYGLGYIVLLAGIAVLFRLGASPQDAVPPPDAGDRR